MEEIKVGEYIRTKNGKIRKLISTVAQYYITDKLSIMEDNQYEIQNIKKHSFNIIDLIEKDDVGIMNCYGLLVKKFITESDILELKLGNYELLKVVTKEQFEKVEYKLDN